MKRIYMAMLTLLFLTNPGWAAEQQVTMAIENMTCALCPITVSNAIGSVDGVKDVAVNLDSHSATVTYDDSVTQTARIAKASTDAGYPAKIQATQ